MFYLSKWVFTPQILVPITASWPPKCELSTRSYCVSLRDNNVAQKASTIFSSYSSLQYEYFHIIISLLRCV
jgi:hypothetical protein